MGCTKIENIGTPRRSKFSWDIKSEPWTDGCGDQKEYKDAVAIWQRFHNALPANNNNRIPTHLKTICLQWQLSGGAKDRCAGICNEDLVGDNGVSLITGGIYKRDSLSVVSEGYSSYNGLCKTRREKTETMKDFELTFAAQVAKCNAI